MPHSWPKSFNIGRMQIAPVHAASFHKHRKFTRARHMWLRLEPNWRLLRSHRYTEWPGIHTYAEINDRLFVNRIQDTKSKAWRNLPEYSCQRQHSSKLNQSGAIQKTLKTVPKTGPRNGPIFGTVSVL